MRARVRPYYLLQADPVRGTGHLRTPLARGRRDHGALQGRLTGIALPKLICDTPGGRGKVPLGRTIRGLRDAGGLTARPLRTFRGEEVDYVDPPREFRLTPSPPFNTCKAHLDPRLRRSLALLLAISPSRRRRLEPSPRRRRDPATRPEIAAGDKARTQRTSPAL